MPNGITSRWAIPFNIYEQGRTYTTDFNFDGIMPIGTAVYVTKTGNDTTGNGTSGNPYRTLAKADAVGATIIYIGAGIWDRTDGFAANYNPTRHISLISKDGPGKAILTRAVVGNTLSWVQQSSPNNNVYLATRSSVGSIIDLTAPRRAGNYMKDGVNLVPIALSKQTSIANCQANPGSWYLTGSSLYVCTFDGRPPDANILVNLVENILAPTNNVNIWVDGIEGWGDSFARHIPATVNSNFWAWRNSASRFCQSTANLLNISNVDVCYSFGCEVSDQLNTYDGFNYHNSLSTTTKFIEVNCTAYRCGANDGGKNDNGSTAHDNVVGVRLNGDYESTWGPSVADTLGARTVNLGVTAGNSNLTGTGDAQRSAFQVGVVSATDGLNSMMWNRNCTSVGGGYAMYAATGGTIYDWGGNIDNTAQHNGGSIIAYP